MNRPCRVIPTRAATRPVAWYPAALTRAARPLWSGGQADGWDSARAVGGSDCQRR